MAPRVSRNSTIHKPFASLGHRTIDEGLYKKEKTQTKTKQNGDLYNKNDWLLRVFRVPRRSRACFFLFKCVPFVFVRTIFVVRRRCNAKSGRRHGLAGSISKYLFDNTSPPHSARKYIYIYNIYIYASSCFCFFFVCVCVCHLAFKQ